MSLHPCPPRPRRAGRGSTGERASHWASQNGQIVTEDRSDAMEASAKDASDESSLVQRDSGADVQDDTGWDSNCCKPYGAPPSDGLKRMV